MVPYVSFTSLTAVSSGETTTDMEAADWPYWIRTTVLESRNVDSNVATPQKFHTIAVTPLHALQLLFSTFLHSFMLNGIHALFYCFINAIHTALLRLSRHLLSPLPL